MSSRALIEEVADFLYTEAELADANDYDRWLALWDKECTYWVPCNRDDYDPTRHVSIIFDNRARLEERCYRLTIGGAHSQEPTSKCCRVIGNVRLVKPQPADNALVEATARMVLVELRMGQKAVYAARCHYTLCRTDQGLRIRRKKVMLLDNDEPLGNMTFLI